jgi:polar amino acid transport system permease protein
MAPLTELVPPLVDGLVVTVELTLGGAAIAVGAAFLAGLGRLSGHRWLRYPAIAYIEIFRGTSALVQLFWFYFVLPLFGLDISAMAAGMLALGLNTGAYGAEVVRGAIQAVPRGQREAAVALNMTRAQTLARIIVPQALIAMLPPAGNLLIELLKNTSLVSLIAIAELTFRAQALRAATLQTGEIFVLILILYFAVSLAIMGMVRWLEGRLARGLDHGSAR